MKTKDTVAGSSVINRFNAALPCQRKSWMKIKLKLTTKTGAPIEDTQKRKGKTKTTKKDRNSLTNLPMQAATPAFF
jgi:hypothetical protein